MEIERKFLVKELPDLSGLSFDKIKQGYFSIKPEKRVRLKGNTYILTEKGEGFLSREEKETVIDEKTGKMYFEMSKTYIIEKTRYYIPYGEYTVELDIYEGRHSGLIVAEVEFSTEEKAKCFDAPSWFGEEITYDANYKNMMLAIKKVDKAE
ncbi:MAG: adenylate cyclase [Clostridia bacterium]|nr:adenylate cyclase [Clostridia bacterium]